MVAARVVSMVAVFDAAFVGGMGDARTQCGQHCQRQQVPDEKLQNGQK